MDYMQRSRAIDELIDPVVDKFKARSRKTEAVYELLKVDLRHNFERFLETELQKAEDHAQEQLSKERERSDRYRSWWRELSNQLSSIQATNGDGQAGGERGLSCPALLVHYGDDRHHSPCTTVQ